MIQEDVPIMTAAVNALGWNQPDKPFQKYLDKQSSGTRFVWVGYCEDKFVGYVTLKLESEYPQFNLQYIPEINDLNVIPEFRSFLSRVT